MSNCNGCHHCYDAGEAAGGFFICLLVWFISPVIGVVANFLANGGLRMIILGIVTIIFLWASEKIYKILWRAFIRNREKKHGMKYDGTCASIDGVLRFYKAQNGASAKKPIAKKK